MPIQKLRPVHLVELYAKLLRSGGHEGRPLAAASVSYVHRVLHRMLGHAATWGVVTTNVASVVSPPSAPESEITILTEDQIGCNATPPRRPHIATNRILPLGDRRPPR
jgi:hypothetical protein